MRIMLAPMEGVTDYFMRRIITGLGGYDRCVTEFLRVTDHLYPDRVFHKIAPELAEGGVTAAGTPVYVQLLGSDTTALALNASRAVALGAPGIDLNFGCPAKTVNRHGGGSALLRDPKSVADIVCAVRNACDPAIPVTAKMRLGFDDANRVLETASLIEQAGASELCIHARTRTDGYKPPAYWQQVLKVSSALEIPVIINGEIWSLDDSRRARQESGCTDLMLGRGALSVPDLALQLQAARSKSFPAGGERCGESPAGIKSCKPLNNDAVSYQPLRWTAIVAMLQELLLSATLFPPRYAGNRTKQWLSYLQRGYPEATFLFEKVKRLRSVEDIAKALT